MSEPIFDVFPVACDGEPEAHGLKLRIGNQTFLIGSGAGYENREQAEWMAKQLQIALSRLVPKPDVEEMVDRFLAWKLPKNFCPDAGISFKPYVSAEYPAHSELYWPTGTNLLNAAQAKAMFEHVLGIAP